MMPNHKVRVACPLLLYISFGKPVTRSCIMACIAAFKCCKTAAVGLKTPTTLRLTESSSAAVVVLCRWC